MEQIKAEPPDPAPALRTLLAKFKFQPSSPRTPKSPLAPNPDALPTLSPKPSGSTQRKRPASASPPSRARTRSASPKKQKRGYAPPSTYAHLHPLSDHLADELDIMVCGINPGHDSAKYGHHYAHRSNHFWRCLHLSGLTTRLHPPSDGHLLPREYNIGLTNLIERPSAEAAEISNQEFLAAVPAFLTKLRAHRPRIVSFVGKVVWDAVERVFKASLPKTKTAPFAWGLQPYKLAHDTGAVPETLFFVVPSTSARVVSHQLPDKVRLFASLKTVLESVKARALDTSSFALIPEPTPPSPSALDPKAP